jgi:hypothetical protein
VPTQGEFYIEHFLGPDGASRLIGAAISQPQASAAAKFPAASAANRSIFYDRSGSPHSARAGYAKLTGRYEFVRALAFASSAPQAETLADVPLSPAPIPKPPAADTAGVTEAYAQARPPKPVQAHDIKPVQETRPLFKAMFAHVPRHDVSQAANMLWASSTGELQAGDQPSALLNLFRDISPDLRKSTGSKV